MKSSTFKTEEYFQHDFEEFFGNISSQGNGKQLTDIKSVNAVMVCDRDQCEGKDIT